MVATPLLPPEGAAGGSGVRARAAAMQLRRWELASPTASPSRAAGAPMPLSARVPPPSSDRVKALQLSRLARSGSSSARGPSPTQHSMTGPMRASSKLGMGGRPDSVLSQKPTTASTAYGEEAADLVLSGKADGYGWLGHLDAEAILEEFSSSGIPPSDPTYLAAAAPPSSGIRLGVDDKHRYWGSMSGREVETELRRLSGLLEVAARDLAIVKDTVWHMEDDRGTVSDRLDRLEKVHISRLETLLSGLEDQGKSFRDRCELLDMRVANVEEKCDQMPGILNRLELQDARLARCEALAERPRTATAITTTIGPILGSREPVEPQAQGQAHPRHQPQAQAVAEEPAAAEPALIEPSPAIGLAAAEARDLPESSTMADDLATAEEEEEEEEELPESPSDMAKLDVLISAGDVASQILVDRMASIEAQDVSAVASRVLTIESEAAAELASALVKEFKVNPDEDNDAGSPSSADWCFGSATLSNDFPQGLPTEVALGIQSVPHEGATADPEAEGPILPGPSRHNSLTVDQETRSSMSFVISMDEDFGLAPRTPSRVAPGRTLNTSENPSVSSRPASPLEVPPSGGAAARTDSGANNGALSLQHLTEFQSRLPTDEKPPKP